MSEEINESKKEDVHASEMDINSSEKSISRFKNHKIWYAVMIVYVIVFVYIGYIAFWPMDFNDPEQTVEKYFRIIDKYGDKVDDEIYEEMFRATINDLIIKSEAEADEMQQLASQSFNIVLGGFLAFLSATVTTIFQSK